MDKNTTSSDSQAIQALVSQATGRLGSTEVVDVDDGRFFVRALITNTWNSKKPRVRIDVREKLANGKFARIPRSDWSAT